MMFYAVYDEAVISHLSKSSALHIIDAPCSRFAMCIEQFWVYDHVVQIRETRALIESSTRKAQSTLKSSEYCHDFRQ